MLALAMLAAGAAWIGQRRVAVGACLACALLLGAARPPTPTNPDHDRLRPISGEATLALWRSTGNGEGRFLLEHLRWPGMVLPSGTPQPTLAGDGQWQGRSPPHPGERVHWEGLLHCRNGKSWLGWARLHAVPGGTTRPLATLRQKLGARLDARLPPADAGLARALLLGDWSVVEDGWAESYRRLGLLHLLAVSGMHFWLWNALLLQIPGLRRTRARWAALLLLGALAGAGPAVSRALAGLLLREWTQHRARCVHAKRLWALALFLECALGAPERQGLGFVLTYSATGFLLSLPQSAQSAWLARTLRTSTAAFLGSAPALHALRGTVEWGSIPLTPVFALTLPARMVLAVVALLPGGSAAASLLFAWMRHAEAKLLRVCDALPGTPLALTQIPAIAVTAAAVIGLFALRAHAQGRCARAALAVLAMTTLLCLRAPAVPACLLLPTGHGLSVVVCGQAGTLLYDLGSRGQNPADLVDRVLLPELARRGWPAPRVGVLSHADADHAAGLRLFQDRDGLKMCDLRAGSELSLTGFFPYTVRVIGCRAAVSHVRNAAGPVLEIRSHTSMGPSRRAVVLGDQFGYALRELRSRLEPGPIDLLVLPHHGLTTDGLDELLDHLLPREAWAACGPEDLPLAAAPLCARRGILLRTTEQGALAWGWEGSYP